jgi:chemotaxis protein methyltransferase CheR
MGSGAVFTMKPEDFRLLREFAEDRFGLIIDEGREASLSARLLPRLQELGLKTYAEYHDYLKFAPHAAEEIKHFVTLITNNETYFFREMAQLTALTEAILPELKAAKQHTGDRKIRILSAGCSSGEEVYSIAMLLINSGLFAWDWDLKVIGLDINHRVLKKAMNGVYEGRTFQATPAPFKDRYFREAEGGHGLRPHVRKVCEFVHGNIMTLSDVVREPMDIIFCRNVLIYFDEDTTRSVISQFSSLLQGPGYLFLGHSESLLRITTSFMPVLHPGAVVYRKRT